MAMSEEALVAKIEKSLKECQTLADFSAIQSCKDLILALEIAKLKNGKAKHEERIEQLE